MSHVTAYLKEDTLAAAKAAAARAQMSVSKWFTQFADAEKQKPVQSCDDFFAEIASLGSPDPDATGRWDALLNSAPTDGRLAIKLRCDRDGNLFSV